MAVVSRQSLHEIWAVVSAVREAGQPAAGAALLAGAQPSAPATSSLPGEAAGSSEEAAPAVGTPSVGTPSAESAALVEPTLPPFRIGLAAAAHIGRADAAAVPSNDQLPDYGEQIQALMNPRARIAISGRLTPSRGCAVP